MDLFVFYNDAIQFLKGNITIVALVSSLIAFLARSYLSYAVVVTLPKIIAAIVPKPMQPMFWFIFDLAANVFLLVDKVASAFIPGPYWKPGRTVSYRLGRMLADENPIAIKICAMLHPFDHDHCKNSVIEQYDNDMKMFEWISITKP